MRIILRALTLLFIASTTMLTSCSVAKKIVPRSESTIIISTTETSNPDDSQRPSPVVIRIYELSDSTTFSTADFFALYESETDTLSADLKHRWELTMRPNTTEKIEKILDIQTTALGIIVAYRNLENSRWRYVLPVDANNEVYVQAIIDSLSVSMNLVE